MSFWGNLIGKKDISSNELVLTAVHTSGTVHSYYLDLSEFETTLETERQNLDEVVAGFRTIIEEAKIADRDFFVEFGHARIRMNDYSAFSIEVA